MRLLSPLVYLAVFAQVAMLPAQSARAGENQLEAYGEGSAVISRFKGLNEMQDNGSLLGLRFHNKVSERLKIFAQLEVGVELVSSAFNFKVSSNTSSGFGKVDDSSTSPFGPRLGLLGVDFAQFGRVSMGKQWSVYYDVTGWTDQFEVFGGQASGTYEPGDGGEWGTGRANQALIYRWNYGGFQVAAQTLMQVIYQSEYDALGASALYKWGFGLSLGIAYIRDDVPPEISDVIIGAQNRAETTAAGVQFVRGHFTGAFVYSYQVGRYVADVDSVDVISDANGAELYLKYAIDRHWAVWGGFNVLEPFDLSPPADPDTRVRYAVLGGGFNFVPNAQVFMETRLDNSVTATGISDLSVFSLGLTVTLSSTAQIH